jgi:hypothetical protein
MTTNQQPSKVPSWPSLYNPGIEILHIEHNAPIQPQGAYLYRPKGGVTQKKTVDLAHTPPQFKKTFSDSRYTGL